MFRHPSTLTYYWRTVPRIPSKKQITTFRKLAQRKYREQTGLYLAEGLRSVSQILRGGRVQIVAILSTREETFFRLPSSQIEQYLVDSETFISLSDTEQSQDIIAICRVKSPGDIDLVKNKTSGVVVAVDGIQDPGNLGTIIRSATWFNCDALLFGSGTVDYYNPKVVRSTAGACEVLPHWRVQLDDVLPNWVDAGWEVCLLDVGSNAERLDLCNFSDKVLLVVGNEGNGISESIKSHGFRRVFIHGNSNEVESLNAGVALSLALYEVGRGSM